VTGPGDGARELRRRVLSLYRDSTLVTRAHVRVRWATCPFPAVAQQVPDSGRILEIGCGHGLLSLLLAQTSSRRDVHGIDVDEDKLDAARGAAVRGDLTATFDVATGDVLPEGPWDGIAIVDVLYLLDGDAQRALLASCAERLAPGGALVVKEMATEPRWKAAWNTAQEVAAVKLLHITAGSDLTFLDPAELASAMAGAGLDVREQPLHRGYPHPHHLLVGRKPG
jgi:2-polyprenyl-3-methyl-5-hydroxy-6-metoxy-1,4-benzoquinol methylase